MQVIETFPSSSLWVLLFEPVLIAVIVGVVCLLLMWLVRPEYRHHAMRSLPDLVRAFLWFWRR